MFDKITDEKPDENQLYFKSDQEASYLISNKKQDVFVKQTAG